MGRRAQSRSHPRLPRKPPTLRLAPPSLPRALGAPGPPAPPPRIRPGFWCRMGGVQHRGPCPSLCACRSPGGGQPGPLIVLPLPGPRCCTWPRLRCRGGLADTPHPRASGGGSRGPAPDEALAGGSWGALPVPPLSPPPSSSGFSKAGRTAVGQGAGRRQITRPGSPVATHLGSPWGPWAGLGASGLERMLQGAAATSWGRRSLGNVPRTQRRGVWGPSGYTQEVGTTQRDFQQQVGRGLEPGLRPAGAGTPGQS